MLSMLSSSHLMRCLSGSCSVRVSRPVARFTGVCRGISSNASAVPTAAPSDPLQRTKPNIVPLAELKVDKPYTDEQFARCIRPYHEQRRPVKFNTQHNGFPYNSSATGKWLSLDYLVEAVGTEYPCDVESMTSSVVRERMTIDFAEFVDYLRRADEYFGLINPVKSIPQTDVMYMAQNDIPPALLPDVSIPGFCTDAQYRIGAGKLYNTMIWIGPRDCVSRLHYDPLDNMFMQIIGTKRIFLVDPTVHTDLIYVDTSVYREHNMSSIQYLDEELDLLSKDQTAREWKSKQVQVVDSNYPNLLQIPTIYETVLYPGDLLFIPSKWWHAVRSLEYSISVNAWWR